MDNVYMELHPSGDIILVAGPREKELVKRVPGSRYEKDTGAWLFPLSWSVCVAARGVFGDRLQVGPELSKWSWAEKGRLDIYKALKELDVQLDLPGWDLLKPWQQPAANWMKTVERALNTDDVGLGKTIETLMALRLAGPGVFPVLIICPNSLKLKWAREFEQWGPEHGGIVVVDGTKTQKAKQLARINEESSACPVHGMQPATPTASTTAGASAGTATSGSCGRRTGSTPSASGRTAGSGSASIPVLATETPGVPAMCETTGGCRKRSTTSECPTPAYCAGPWPSTLITATSPDASEGPSAGHATEPSLLPSLTTSGSSGPTCICRNQVVIINWEALRLHSRLAPYGSIQLTEDERTPKELDEWAFRTVIADEAHRAVDPGSKQTRAWWNLSHTARWSYALTATPLTNKPDDFWSLAHGLWPSLYPRKTTWVSRYCHAGQNMHGGFEVWGFKQETKEELFSFVDPFMIRRTGEVAGNEPPVFDTIPVVMGTKQAKTYRDMQKEMLSAVDGDFLVAGNPLEVRLRLRQLAAGVPVLGDTKRKNPVTGEWEVVTGVVGLKAPSCKIDALLEMLADEPDEPLVVFAESRKLIELAVAVMAKHKIKAVELTGTVPTPLRDQRIALFQDPDEGVRVALCTYGAVAEGISLGRSGHLVRLQVSESMVKNKQAVGRIDGLRRSKPGPIRVTDIITVDTVDEDVTINNLEKAGHLDELTRDRLRAGK